MQPTIALTGWGHPPDALRSIAPDALHLSYTSQPSVEAALRLLEQTVTPDHMVIGWSMGGQLAALAIAQRRIQPRKLVLIAAPYQFVASQRSALGLPQDVYQQFAANFRTQPSRALGKAYKLIAHGDSVDISAPLENSRATLPDHPWEYWYSALLHVDLDAHTFAHFPPTTLIHGGRDAVVGLAHAQHFNTRLPNSTLHVLPDCGHAPHWHNPTQVRAWLDA